MKITLIFPNLRGKFSDVFEESWVTKIARPLFHLGGSNHTPPLSLLTLAAVTPPHIEIEIIDERIEPIDFDAHTDLVGISVVTRAASRAYQIAEAFHKRGVTVVAGGIHPSILPNEVLQHVDAVVVGEGESGWPQLLDDFEKKQLQRIYKGKPQNDLDEIPFPRRDLIHHPDKYFSTKVITATRGCQNSCSFCACGFGTSKRFRTRAVDRVVAELEQVPGDVVFFLDDNLGWDKEYFKELLYGLIPLRIKWFGAISLSVLDDPAIVELATRSGCVSMLIGFESVRPETIREMKKERTNDPARYGAIIQNLQEKRIAVRGQFIIGFDSDDPSIFRETIDFINKTRIEMPTINTLIPYPGTPVYRKFSREGRILDTNWDQYDTAGGFVVYEPKRMSRQELQAGYLETVKEIYSYGSIMKRIGGLKSFTPNIFTSLYYNLAERQSAARFSKLISAHEDEIRH